MSNGKKEFMPFVCCGDPTPEFTVKLIEELVRCGASGIELGIPFSDPIADGPTIQEAGARALGNGMNAGKALEVVGRVREKEIKIPIFLMTYYNIIIANGFGNFIRDSKKAGANGFIIPDLPIEESSEMEKECAKSGMELIRLISVNTSEGRIKEIAGKSGSFIYAVPVLGTTGTRSTVLEKSVEFIRRAKKLVGKKLVVGFGISEPLQAKIYAKAGADGVIIGSKIVEIYSKCISGKGFDENAALGRVEKFAGGITSALKGRAGL